MFGDKQFPSTGYPTPESTPESTTCLTVQVPGNSAWWAIYIGLLFTLTDPAAWQQLEGGMSREDAAAAATDIFIAALKNSETDVCGVNVPVPFWDTSTGDDTSLEAPADDQSWYGRWDGETWGEALSYWAITAFLMTGVSEGAAVQFVTPLRHFRLTLKANPHGAKLLVLMDSNLFQLVDLFAPADTVVTADIISPGTTMLLVHSGEHNPDATPNEAGNYEVNIVRSELSEADVAPTTIRYDPDCACVQTTSDGGATWQDNPNADPRTSIGYLLPPVASADPACDAAASIIANFRDGLTETLSAISAGANAEGAASVLLTFLDFLSGIGILILLLIDFCTLIISIGVTGVEAAFTSAVYDELQCIIQCAIGADGSISAAQFADIQTKVSDHYGALSDVNLVFQGWLAQLGNVGLQNIGAQKHIVGDCSGCECAWCYNFDFLTSDHGFTLLSAYGVWTAGVGWESTSAGGSNELLGVGLTCTTSHMIYCEAVINCVTSNADNNGGVGIFNGSSYPGAAWSGGHLGIATHSITLDMPNAIQVLISVGNGGSGHFICTSMKFKGIGTNPFGADNC